MGQLFPGSICSVFPSVDLFKISAKCLLSLCLVISSMIRCNMVETFLNSLVLICFQTKMIIKDHLSPYIFVDLLLWLSTRHVKFICLTYIDREGEGGKIRQIILDLMTLFTFSTNDCLCTVNVTLTNNSS